MMNYGYYGHMGWFGPLFSVIFWVAVVWFIVWFVRHARGPSIAENPMDILRLRYAKGELTKKQFDEMKKDI